MKDHLFTFTILAFLYCFASGQHLPLIPTPQQIIWGEGKLDWFPGDTIRIIYSDQVTQDSLRQNGLRMLIQTLEDRSFTVWLEEQTGVTNDLHLTKHRHRGSQSTVSKFTLPPEGYWLKVLPFEILASASDHAGFFYATISLKQLLTAYGKTDSLPCLTIIDYPSFGFRGVMDDISRGPLPHLDYMKQQVRRLARYKINVFSFYIEHIVKTTKHHTYSPMEGVTLDELRELQEYAAKFNIQLMGSFQSLGHFRNILSHSDYTHLGVSDRMLKPGDKDALEFLFDIYEELTPVFSHSIFNINCDETYDLARGYLAQEAENIGEGNIYYRHISSLLSKVESMAKRPGIWGDMLLKYPHLLSQIPKETVVFTWNYDDLPDFSPWIDPIKENNLDFIACTGVVNSYKIWPDLEQTKGNIRNFTIDAFRKGALGMLNTVWDDGGRHFFHCDWYGVALGAAYAWNADSLAHLHFDHTYDQLHFGSSGFSFSQMSKKLAQCKEFGRLSRLNNLLLNLDFGSSTFATEYIDTTEFSSITRYLQPLSSQISKTLDQREILGQEQINELRIWKLKVDELLLNIETARKLLDRNSYDKGFLNQLKSLYQRWELLRDDFAHFWRLENRNYWLNVALDFYNQKLEILKQMISDHELSQNPASTQIRHKMVATDGFYFLYWLGAGPFQNREGMSNDYLLADGGERNIKPAAIDYFVNQDGVHQGWNKIISTRPAELDFSDFYAIDGSSPNGLIAYASSSIDSDETTKVQGEFRSSCPCQIFLDQDMLVSIRGESEEIISMDLTLEAGRNYLLVKCLSDGLDEWKFSFRIKGEVMVQNKYKYYLR